MSSNQEKATVELLEPGSQAENIVNGVNVTALFQTVEAVRVNPVIAKFRFNVKNEWLDGAHNRSIINGFHGAMQDIEAATFNLENRRLSAGKPASRVVRGVSTGKRMPKRSSM